MWRARPRVRTEEKRSTLTTSESSEEVGLHTFMERYTLAIGNSGREIQETNVKNREKHKLSSILIYFYIKWKLRSPQMDKNMTEQIPEKTGNGPDT